jgi:Phage integrase, N-terminal SAM-like domain
MAELLDQLREKIRVKHYSTHTELAYVDWAARLLILFHQKQHPLDMGEPEASQFLSHLATQRHAAASSQNQALSAHVFLSMDFLAAEAPRRRENVKGNKPPRGGLEPATRFLFDPFRVARQNDRTFTPGSAARAPLHPGLFIAVPSGDRNPPKNPSQAKRKRSSTKRVFGVST